MIVARLKKGDTVAVISGKDKGKTGENKLHKLPIICNKFQFGTEFTPRAKKKRVIIRHNTLILFNKANSFDGKLSMSSS